jgi:hypothetical protein
MTTRPRILTQAGPLYRRASDPGVGTLRGQWAAGGGGAHPAAGGGLEFAIAMPTQPTWEEASWRCQLPLPDAGGRLQCNEIVATGPGSWSMRLR